MATTPIDYAGAPLTSVQCPRCGQERDVPLVAHVATEIEFAGVCSTPVEGGGFCSTTLRLTATAHVFPAG